MNRLEHRTIFAAIAVVGLILVVSDAQAQRAPTAPPPNPQPPPAATSPAATPPAATPPAPGPVPSAEAPAPPAAPSTDLAPGSNPVGGADRPAEPGFLGVVAEDRQDNAAGVRVVDVQSGGPADRGGLKSQDVITSVNGTSVRSQSDMIPVLQKLGPGSTVTFMVDRNGKQEKIEVILGTRPPAAQRKFEKFGQIPESLPEPNGNQAGPQGAGQTGSIPTGSIPTDRGPSAGPTSGQPGPAAPGPTAIPFAPNGTTSVPDAASGPNAIPNLPQGGSDLQLGARIMPPVEPSRRPLLGVRTRAVSEEIQQRLKLPTASGALVVSRTLGSPAARAGIPLNAVITAVDGKPVNSPLDLTALISQAGAGREVEIAYFSGGSEQRVKVRLGELSGTQSSLFGGTSASAGAIPPPPAPEFGRIPVADDKARIDALERRVEQLEHRVDDLENQVRRSK